MLHDGPPYANGSLHCGHAMNKILKDFINRKQALNGRQVHYVPGWDCHGLPIELKVLQKMKSKERQALTPVTLREKAASFAKKTVGEQSASFERYGIFGDFENPYLTLQPEFEAAQIRVFGEMFKKGFIFRGRKPVHWSPSSQTALAEAELEYPEGHISKSIYVAFEVVEPSDAVKEHHSGDSPVKVAIWTTTPWTMPANLAVAVNPDLSYSIVEHSSTGKLIVATDLIGEISVSSPFRLVFVNKFQTTQITHIILVYFKRKNWVCLKKILSKSCAHCLDPTLSEQPTLILYTTGIPPCWLEGTTLQPSPVQALFTPPQVMVKRIT